MKNEKTAAKKKKFQWWNGIGIGCMSLFGGVCGYVISSALAASDTVSSMHDRIVMILGLFFGIYAAFLFHIIVHEAGHLVFGLMTGYRFGSFRILSFLWLHENGRLRCRRLSIAGTGGQCLMVPPDLQDGKIPIVWYNLGGSIANLVVGALFLLGYFLCADAVFVGVLLLLFALIGFAIAATNGIPLCMGTVNNDGYNAFAMRRSRDAVEAFWIQLKVAEQSGRGIRIKDMPAAWFSVPTDDAMKNGMVATRGVLACSRLMDECNFREADALMAHLLAIDSGIVGMHRCLLMCDRIYVELIGENRRAVVDRMMSADLKKFMKAMKQFPSVLRTQYAHALLCERDFKKAEAIRCAFDKAAKTYPYPHEIDSERGLMRIADGKVRRADDVAAPMTSDVQNETNE